MMTRKITLLLTLIVSIIILYGCKEIDYGRFVGVYEIESATLNGIDITNEYYLYTIEIREDKTMKVNINYLNILDNHESTFKANNNTLTETYLGKTYKYVFDETNETLTYKTKTNDEELIVVLKRKEQIDIPKGVAFEGILFGDDIDLTKRFNYAPSILIEEEDGQTVMHIWYCANRLSGVIVDHIGYRKGILNEDNRWEFSEESYALAPSIDTWDSRHTCDPSVIKGEFNYNNETYTYMMAYLGCTTEDYSNNETGIAIAKSPEGPWIKMDHLNPIVPWDRDNQSGSWGTGMPSLLSVDGKGKVLLFYSNASVGVSVDYYDFTNMDDPILTFTRNIVSTGLTNPNGTFLNYVGLADFSYDPFKNRLYMSSYTNTKNPPDVTVTRVNSHGAIHYIDGLDSMEEVVEAIENQSYVWQLLDFIGPEDTGYDRNHNLGLVRDAYGYLYNSDQVMVVVSTGHVDYPNDNIYTYRLMGYIIQP